MCVFIIKRVKEGDFLAFNGSHYYFTKTLSSVVQFKTVEDAVKKIGGLIYLEELNPDLDAYRPVTMKLSLA